MSRNKFPFTFGGTKDIKYAAISALVSNDSKKLAVCDICNFLDVKKFFDYDKISSLCSTRKLIEEHKEKISRKEINFFNFGLQKENFTREDKLFIDSNKGFFHIYGIDFIRKFDDRKKYEKVSEIYEPITQFGLFFLEKINEIALLHDEIYFSISLEALNVRKI